MDFQNKQIKACGPCRTRKVKCVRFQGSCHSCIRRKNKCTFETQLPPISALLNPPEVPLNHLLNQRAAAWNLDHNVPTLVLTFLHHAGPNNNLFPLPVIFDLLHEPTMPEIFPLVLSAINHYLCPTSTANAHKAIQSLQRRDSKLLIASLSLLNQTPSYSTSQYNIPSPQSSEHTIFDYRL
ncbi:hypothetical protein DSO57_1038818 [Entomophthora muscae]|uniref:Uncharacterized protein n=1 Tax=Entomophthora muscae TaxID=34485 RepID=A0ACC2SBM0_9FUNG|nr:hypothetical protein DSO57_1038818 [Entomophthora muscae]